MQRLHAIQAGLGRVLLPKQGAEFGMREELILKTAVLAERFYPDLQWYVDSMLTLIERAGDLATKDIWHSTVQIITNYPALHEYAARKVTSAALLRCSCCDAVEPQAPEQDEVCRMLSASNGTVVDVTAHQDASSRSCVLLTQPEEGCLTGTDHVNAADGSMDSVLSRGVPVLVRRLRLL